jgi:sugar lactone lactonase YvrE
VEIDPSDRGWTAGIYDESRRGWLANHADNMPARYAFRQSQWNQVRIVAQGSRLRTWLNGVPAAELIDDMTPRGFIALQVHGVGGRKDPLTVKFKNIRLRDLTGVEVIEADSHSRTLPAAPPGPVFVTGAQPERIVSELEFAEGPAVGPAGDLYFSDIPRDTIYRLNLQTLEKQTHTSQSGNSNGLAFTVNGALIACESGTRAVTRTVGEKRQVLIDKFEERRLNSPNDLTLDGVGGIYFTDPRYGERQSMELEFEGVYYLDAQRKLKLLTRELTRPNGIALSPDNRWLYVADHAGSKLWRFDVVKPGELANGQVIAAVGSDGMTVDAYGRVFITWGREVMVLSAGGETVDRIEFPAATTNCELWDGWLYVTTPNELYRVATTTCSWRQPANK